MKSRTIKWSGLWALMLIINTSFSQEQLTGLFQNQQIATLFAKEKYKKSAKLIYYTPVELPFVDDFSNYTGYPDTTLWISNQGYVNHGFGVNAPTLGVVTLDALDHKGKIYSHGTKTSFSADTLLSKPIRLDSVFVPFPRAMSLSDSLYFSFFFQPGGGTGNPWERIGNAPENGDSLLLDFGYQTGDTTLLYYITDTLSLPDTIQIGDTIFSHCHPSLYIIAERTYYPNDLVALPCDSVNALEMVWTTVWACPGMELEEFIDTFGTYFLQVMIPILDSNYLNKGFQFRFRNLASLEYETDAPTWAGNVDQWNIDYVRLNRSRTQSDTIIDDVAIVENPGSMLSTYTQMPWTHFSTSPNSFLRSDFDVKLTNLYNTTKNTTYSQQVLDGDGNTIGTYSGGAYNILPFYQNGYQDYAAHANPTLANITFPSGGDSVEISLYHIFKEAGAGDKRQSNDTAVYLQTFYNYFAYDDGVPESGYLVTSSVSPYTTSLAVGYQLATADTLQAIRIYFNHVYDNANDLTFTLTVWGDQAGNPGTILYEQVVEQEMSNDIYGLQHFHLDEALPVSGKIYVGYQTTNRRFLNVGFDQNNNASEHVFYRTNSAWANSFIVGTPIIRPVVGKKFQCLGVAETQWTDNVLVYPNPACGEINIILPSEFDAENAQMAIYAVNGQKIYSGHCLSQFNVEQLSNGFYILQITDKNNQKSLKKFVVNR